MPQITAKLNYLRIAPRKVRAVVDLIKGLDVDLAEAQLRYLTRRPAKPLLKLLNSAVANARQNAGLNKNHLYIKEITVDEGMKLKRYKPKGFSLIMPIQKKTSHIRIVLDELSEETKKKKDELIAKMPKLEAVKEKPADLKVEKEAKAEKPRFGKEKQIPSTQKKSRFGEIKTLGRRIFRRKAV
ncbi:MAG: 50S ribosomal protein L22 [Patescibacteria group bacterium]